LGFRVPGLTFGLQLKSIVEVENLCAHELGPRLLLFRDWNSGLWVMGSNLKIRV
jgi:hypothetical protein